VAEDIPEPLKPVMITMSDTLLTILFRVQALACSYGMGTDEQPKG
jgi:hypothetical protein